MTKTVRAAAIYSRISSDQDGTALGVARQEQDCQELADGLGWPVAEVYRDNDVSAWSGKTRPAYQRLLDDLATGARDAVLIYHPDRLTRRPRDLEEFVELLARVDAKLKFVRGDADITNGDGLMMLRVQAAFAAHESAAKSRRVARKYRERAEQGLPIPGGHQRPFGYEPDKMTIRDSEAAMIRDLVGRYLAGESWRSLAQWLQDNQVPTSTGAAWTSISLRTMLLSPRIAGLREYQGKVIGPARWSAIISTDDRDRMLALVEQRKLTGRRTARRHLLSGLLRCSRCGGKMFAADRPDRRTYTCLSGPDHRGCGAMRISADPVEELITQAVLRRVSSPALTQAMAGQAAEDNRAAALAAEADQAQGKLTELTTMWAAGQLTAPEWHAARQVLDQQLTNARRQLAQLTRTDALNSINPASPKLAQEFAQLPLSRQHAIIAAVLDHAAILPGTAGARRVDPARVQPHWRI